MNFEVKKGSTEIIKKEYQFLSDGSLKYMKDDINAKFDRLYRYDFAGRTVDARSGMEARGGTGSSTDLINIPYKRGYEYTAFGEIKALTGRYYNTNDATSYSYTNGHEANSTYDLDGNTTADVDAHYKYDAAGRIVETTPTDVDDSSTLNPPVKSYFDGDGKLLKRTANYGSTTPAPVTNYYIRSTALGKVVSEADDTGRKVATYVPANGVTLAEQRLVRSGGTTTELLTFIHQDASGASAQSTDASGNAVSSSIRAGEYDAMGRNVADAGPYVTLDTSIPTDQGSGIDMFATGEGYRPGRMTYVQDGLPVPESQMRNWLDSGMVGGAFGLVEMSARMSAQTRIRDYSVYTGEGWRTYDNRFANEDAAIAFARSHGSEIVFRKIVVGDSSWLPESLISERTQQTARRLDVETVQGLRANLQSLMNNKNCGGFVREVIKNLDDK